MGVKTEEELITEGIEVLIEQLGYANVARFIAMLGGEGDMSKEIRKIREKTSIEDILGRIERKYYSTMKE